MEIYVLAKITKNSILFLMDDLKTETSDLSRAITFDGNVDFDWQGENPYSLISIEEAHRITNNLMEREA